MQNRFAALAKDHEVSSINTKWETIKKTYVETATSVLGYRQKKNKEWITSGTWKKIKERKQLKAKALSPKSLRVQQQVQKAYKMKDKEVKKSARNDKRAFAEELAGEAECAAARGEMNAVYKITKRLCGKKSTSLPLSKTRTITTSQQNVSRPPDGYNTSVLTDLFRDIWETDTIPDDWTKRLIVKIPKKGDLQNCDNWRGITLLSIPSKVFCRILLARIETAIDTKLRQEKAVFRRGRGCIDQIFALRNIIEQCIEWTTPLFINFIDFQKAFDSVHRKDRQAQQVCHADRLKHYISKTKVMCINATQDAPITADGEPLDFVEEFTYLVASLKRIVQHNQGKAWESPRCPAQLQPVWRSKQDSLRTKLRLYNSIVKPVLRCEQDSRLPQRLPQEDMPHFLAQQDLE
ncbi:hypothetical protein ACROYT_G036051 [Oculina patagonica]